jgi:Ca2+/Na+ antiporter
VNAGLIGGILGGVLGLAGGVLGTYFSIRNTNGPRERAFMIRMSAFAWLGVTAFLALLVLLPNPWRFLVWIPYGVLLPLFIVRTNRSQQRIRQEEASSRAATAAAAASASAPART